MLGKKKQKKKNKTKHKNKKQNKTKTNKNLLPHVTSVYFACLSNSFIQGIGKGNYSNKASSGVGYVAEG